MLVDDVSLFVSVTTNRTLYSRDLVEYSHHGKTRPHTTPSTSRLSIVSLFTTGQSQLVVCYTTQYTYTTFKISKSQRHD